MQARCVVLQIALLYCVYLAPFMSCLRAEESDLSSNLVLVLRLFAVINKRTDVFDIHSKLFQYKKTAYTNVWLACCPRRQSESHHHFYLIQNNFDSYHKRLQKVQQLLHMRNRKLASCGIKCRSREQFSYFILMKNYFY